MRSDELAEKLGKAFASFGQGKDKKIKHKDLSKIIAKLTALRDGLAEQTASTKAAKKAERLAKQRDAAALLLDRATWLQTQIAPDAAKADVEVTTGDAGVVAEDPVATPEVTETLTQH